MREQTGMKANSSMQSGIRTVGECLYVLPRYLLPAELQNILDRYGVRVIRELPEGLAVSLVYDDNGVALRDFSSSAKPVRGDFVSGRCGYRLATMTGTAQPLLKAIGFKRNKVNLRVLDATAGLGVDGVSMAVAGCSVCMLEKSRIMSVLLEDALRRAGMVSDLKELSSAVNERIILKSGDSIDFFAGVTRNNFDVIYLDPMFPERQKASKVKKEMEMAKMVAVAADNAEEILRAALETPVKRVVLKRPLKSPVLEKGFSAQIKGKSIRFDIYLR